MSSAPVTDWPERIALTLATVGLLLLAFYGMRRGWRARAGRQSAIPAPVESLGTAASAIVQFPGRFIGSSISGDWLDRVVVHDLGIPSKCTMFVHSEGVVFRREGARDVCIPSASVREIRIDDAVGADVVDSAVVVTWELGPALIDTGFRAQASGAYKAILTAVTSIAPRVSETP